MPSSPHAAGKHEPPGAGRKFTTTALSRTDIPTPRTEDDIRLDLARLERERQQAKDLIRAIDVAINRDLDELRAR